VNSAFLPRLRTNLFDPSAVEIVGFNIQTPIDKTSALAADCKPKSHKFEIPHVVNPRLAAHHYKAHLRCRVATFLCVFFS